MVAQRCAVFNLCVMKWKKLRALDSLTGLVEHSNSEVHNFEFMNANSFEYDFNSKSLFKALFDFDSTSSFATRFRL